MLMLRKLLSALGLVPTVQPAVLRLPTVRQAMAQREATAPHRLPRRRPRRRA